MQPSFLTMTDSLLLDTTTPNLQDTAPPAVTTQARPSAGSTQVNLLDLYQGDSSTPGDTSTSTSNTTNDEDFNPSNRFSPTITINDLNYLIERIRTSTPPNVPPLPQPTLADDSITNIIRLETAASNGLSTKFDGQPHSFPSWIRKFRLTVQLAHWNSAIKISISETNGTTVTYDITTDFAKIPKAVIVQQATNRWTNPTLLTNLSKKGTPEFNIKLLCLFLTNSISDRYHTVLQNRAGDLLANDGQYLLWLLCTDIHYSSISYEQSIKDQIRSGTIKGEYNNDLQEYITGTINLCRLILKTEDNTTHNDLLDPIFAQLQSTPYDRFTYAVDGWFEEYLEQTIQLTPLTLLDKADKKLHILRAARKLQANTNQELMALRAHFDNHNKQITSSLNKIASNLQANHPTQRQYSNQENTHQPRQRPEWFQRPPSEPSTVMHFENREWRWCPKCNYGRGRWVSTHHPDKHVDGYVNPRRNKSGANNESRPPLHDRKRNQDGHQNPQPKRPYYGAQIAMSDFIFHNHEEPTED